MVFSEQRSDVQSVLNDLRSTNASLDPLAKRAVIQRAVALMTSGTDTSSLFPEMIMCCFTPDMVSKKLVYFFITTHSARNPELGILGINTLMKECNAESPLTRGLALRSFASLRVPNVNDYLLPAVQTALKDNAPYVRRIAVMCTFKIYRRSAEDFRASNFVAPLTALLRDSDPQVCLDALTVLRDISAAEQKLADRSDDGADPMTVDAPTPLFSVTKAILYYFLNRIRDFRDWQLPLVVSLLYDYVPSSEEEMFNMMNLLEERLQSHHSGVILSISRAFMHLTENYPNVHRQVVQRFVQPLVTLMASTHNTEAAYAALCHILLLVQRDAEPFKVHVRAFYCRYNQPAYVKVLRMEVLTHLADATLAAEIVQELRFSCFSRWNTEATHAIRALGKVALRVPDTVKTVVSCFLELLSSRAAVDEVRGTTLTVMEDILRKYKDINLVREFLKTLVEMHQEVEFADQESRTALVWVLGEWGEYIEDAPYMLEALAGNVLAESAAFRLQMLTSAMTLFFKRPPEVQKLLGSLFQCLVNDFSNADVLDRALLYYRLLQQNPAAAARVVAADQPPIHSFAEDEATELVDRLLEEFDTFAVVYGVPSDTFMANAALSDQDDEEDDDGDSEDCAEETWADGAERFGAYEGYVASTAQTGQDQGTSLLAGAEAYDVGGAPIQYRAPQPGAASDPWNLFDNVAAVDTPADARPLVLADDVELSPEAFQATWGRLSGSDVRCPPLHNHNAAQDAEAIELTLEDANIFTLASGVQSGVLRLFLYAQEQDNPESTFLVELIVSPTGEVSGTLKCTNPSRAALLQPCLGRALSTL